jgi:elongation factor 1-gamma
VVYKDEHVNLNDGNAIAFYISDTRLKGDNMLTQSQILQWMNFSDNNILPSVCNWVLPLAGISSIKSSEDSIKEAKNNLLEIMDTLNRILLNKNFLVEESITLADITVFVTLLPAYGHVLNLEIRKRYHNVDKWFENILQQLNVKSVIIDFKYY